MVAMERFERRRLRPTPQSADGDDLAGRGGPDHDRRDAAETHILRLHDAERDTAADARVDGVAARLQNLKRRLRRQIMTGGDHVPCADNAGTGR